MRSTPSWASAASTAWDSSSVNPPRWKSAELSLMPTAKPGLTRPRMRRTTSRPKRIRPSRSPPQPSSRRFDSGDRNCEMRYPWAPCTCTPLKPAVSHTAAAVAKRSMISSISAGRSSRGVLAPGSFVGIGLGATGVCPSAKGLAWRPGWLSCAQIAPPESWADLAQRESASRSRSSSMTMLPGSPSCARSTMTLPVIIRP